MKLFSTSISSYKSQPEHLLCEGSLEEIANFINSVGDGWNVGKVEASDLEENGGNWGCPPDDWSPEKPFYYGTPTEIKGGFETLKQAVFELVSDCEDYQLHS